MRTVFDTLTAARTLEAAGIEPRQAEAIAQQIGAAAPVDLAALATKADLYRALWIQSGVILGTVFAVNIGLVIVLFSSLFAAPALAQNFLTDVPAGSRGMVSGPGIGERIPDFSAYDQNGNRVGLDGVMGPNGAMVVFHRSADW